MSSQNQIEKPPENNTGEAPPAKFKKRFIIIPIAVILMLALTFFLWPSNISRQEAQEIALAHIGGGSASVADMEIEGLQRVWAVEIFYDGLVHEVYVSTRTGNIVGVEIGSWD